MTIFVSVVAFCDAVLSFTVERALATARRPDSLRFGIVDQTDGAPIGVPAASSYLQLPARAARGPCWARAIAMTFYSGEDWYLQVDSHVDFEDGWDEALIALAASLPPQSVVSAYPAPFVFEDGRPVRTPNEVTHACAVRRGTTFRPGLAVLDFEAYEAGTRPVLGFHVAAGCLFARGRFALEFPYDPAIYFNGEEQSLALRLFTHGWDLFHARMPIYHLYSDRPTGLEPRPMHWDVDKERTAREQRSQQRLLALVSGEPLGAYGLGNAHTVADFAAFSGIDYSRRRIAARAYPPAGQPIGRPLLLRITAAKA